jgi:fused signal recognition particle receptor
MFGFFRRKPAPPPAPVEASAPEILPSEAAALPTQIDAPAHEQLPVALAPVIAPSSFNWAQKLKMGLSKTRGNLVGLFSRTKIDEALYEDLESALLASDSGFATTEYVLAELKEVVRKQRLESGDQVREALATILTALLQPLEGHLQIDRAKPLVLMMTGVNGAGKTTSIGKLTHHLRTENKSILLAAADTFRAAAREQLLTWGERNQVQVISQEGGDPAAVAFDAINAGVARGMDVILIDTAGRLPTQAHLMEELRKIRRVAAKALPEAPHEVILVLDGNTGQNMLAQVKAFDEAVTLTGLIVTKLDGTAKGGALAALAYSFKQGQRVAPIPVYFIGVGEGLDDLQSFSASEFAQALFN